MLCGIHLWIIPQKNAHKLNQGHIFMGYIFKISSASARGQWVKESCDQTIDLPMIYRCMYNTCVRHCSNALQTQRISPLGSSSCILFIIDWNNAVDKVLRYGSPTSPNTVWCHYNEVNFLLKHHDRHPIARPWGWGMGCLLRVRSLVHALLLSSQCHM